MLEKVTEMVSTVLEAKSSVELRSLLIDAQQISVKLQEENAELKSEIVELKSEIKRLESAFESPKVGQYGGFIFPNIDGECCPHCWNFKKALFPLTRDGSKYRYCSGCKQSIPNR